MYVIKYKKTNQWVNYHELPGLYLENKFYGVATVFATENKAQEVMQTEEFKYLMGESYIEQPCTLEDFEIVKV